MAAKTKDPTIRCDKAPVALIDRAVVHDGAPILFVFHEDDDPSGWAFLKQHMNNENYAEDLMLDCLHCILERHPELAELRDLPEEHWAHREDATSPWRIGAFDEDEDIR